MKVYHVKCHVCRGDGHYRDDYAVRVECHKCLRGKITIKLDRDGELELFERLMESLAASGSLAK